ncbi:MAG: hypothetical protein EBR99_02265, partial [Actinobacteria bacterium]|nr:hypothetical protein [Actinomycetota bacterium]
MNFFQRTSASIASGVKRFAVVFTAILVMVTGVVVEQPAPASAAAVTKMSQVVAQEYKTYNSRSIAVDSTRLWVTYPYQGLVKVYNKSDRSFITSINVGGMPKEIQLDGTYAWVANMGSGSSLIGINMSTYVIAKQYSIPSQSDGGTA